MRSDTKVQPGQGTLTPSTLVSSGRSADPEGERRQITVMYYAMAVSSAGTAEIDPEDLGEMVRAFEEVCGAVLSHAGGHVSQAMGDGTLVYFGFPVAHGGDAQQAVGAGLEIVDAAAQLDARACGASSAWGCPPGWASTPGSW
jgi:class 3 adenylate cyclase